MPKDRNIFALLVILCVIASSLTAEDILFDFIIQHNLGETIVRSHLLPHQIQIQRNKARKKAQQEATYQNTAAPANPHEEAETPEIIPEPEEDPRKVAEKSAFTTIKKAAEDGYTPAQDLLAYCYSTGTGTEKDDRLAFCWHLCTVFTSKSTDGIEALISCFERGAGVTKDLAMASLLRSVLYPIISLSPTPEPITSGT